MARSIRTDIENNGKVDFLSKPLLRTNAKLSSNIKLIVSDSGLFLESINADPKLAGATYKKYRVKPEGSYSYDVSKFWNDNRTPFDLVYKVKKDFSDFSILNSYDQQFEESYNYGASVCSSKLYREKIKLMAPIWLDKNVPGKFIIYRVDDAKSLSQLKGGRARKLEEINDVIQNSTLIKTFDLSGNSDLGKYIRNHVSHESFPTAPLKVSFDRDEKVFYNGIDLIKGGFVSKGEFQYKDNAVTDKPLIEFNDFITDGFVRNKIACANLINLEFLFNDEEAKEFSISRYFGLFVDEQEVGEGIVKKIDNDNITFSSIQHSLDPGLSNDWMALPYHEFFKRSPILGWVKNSVNYHNVKNGRTWIPQNLELKIDSNNQDYSDFIGIKPNGNDIETIINKISEPDFLEIKVTDQPSNGDRFSVINLQKQIYVIKVLDTGMLNAAQSITDDLGTTLTWTTTGTILGDLQAIKTAWPTTGTFGKYTPQINEKNGEFILEVFEDINNMEETHTFNASNALSSLISIKRSFSPPKITESTFFVDNTISRGKSVGRDFSGLGSLKNIANAIAEVITENTTFKVLIKENILYIKSPVNGYNRLDDVLLLENSNAQFLTIDTPSDVNNTLEIGASFLATKTAYSFSGGNFVNRSLYVPEGDDDQFVIGDYLLDSKNKFNKIVDLVKDSRTIDSEFKKIILENQNDGIEGSVNVYHDFKIQWGYFDAYDMYDLNFDFYDEQNSKLKELYYEDPSKIPSSSYFSLNANIATNKIAYSDRDNFIKPSKEYYSNLVPLLEGEEDKLKYSGPVEEKTINSEFERLEENNITDFATTSRVVPFINKWVLKDSLNVRQNPYYLNTNEAFGETNFSPDFSKESRDENGMTHEWFYLDKTPGYISTTDMGSTLFSYVNVANNLQIDINNLKDINHDYFKSYFLSNGYWLDYNGDTAFNAHQTYKRYTFINGGGAKSHASTIFNGIKFTPRLRKKIKKEVTKEFVNSGEFNGYRFSTVLKTNFDDSFSNELLIKVVQNKKHKFIVLYLDLYLGDDNFSWLNRKLLYELDHKLKDDNGTLAYADIALSGSLDLSTTNPQNMLPTGPTGFTEIVGLPHFNGSLPQFDTQVLKDPDTGLYGKITINLLGVDYLLQVASVVDSTTLLIEGGLELASNPGVYQGVSFFTPNEYIAATYKYENGGVFAHTALLNQLCIKSVADRINSTDLVEYITVEEDGTEIEDRFTLLIEDGNEIIKRSVLTAEVDTEKPKAFGLSNTAIGYKLEKRSFEYFSFLKRQNGDYTVDMKPIITFREMFAACKVIPDQGDWAQLPTNTQFSGFYGFPQEDFDYDSVIEAEIAEALYKKLNYCRNQFNIGKIHSSDFTTGLGLLTDFSFGIIKNYFFHKVNEIDTKGVIKLSESDALPPKYNLIGEIAIEKTDKDVFQSRWSDDFHIRSGGGGRKKTVPGTKNIVEEKNFVSSCLIKLEEGYDIFNFTSRKYKTLEELDAIKLSGNNDFEINFFEDESKIIMDFDLSKSTIRMLDGLGVRNTIEKYIEPEKSFGSIDSLDDDVEFYIRENVLPLYSISGIDLFSFSSKKTVTEIEQVNSLNAVYLGDYILDNNFTYKVDSKNSLNFRLIYNKKKGFNYKIRPLIKIKS